MKLARIEDRPTPKEVYNWRVYLSAITATFAAMMIGYDSAFIGTSLSLKSFKTEFGMLDMTSEEVGFLSANIVSTYQAGCFFGAIFGYPIGLYLGRKWGLLISAVIFQIGAALQTAASASTGLGIIYGGRVVAGIAIGIASNLAPIYVAEVSPPAIRGRLIGSYEMCWQIGGAIGFWINYGASTNLPEGHTQWLIAFAVQLIPGGLLFIGSLFIVESPRWLMTRGRKEDAMKNLAYLRHLPEDAPYVVEEYAEIEAAIDHEKTLLGNAFWGPIRSVFSNRQLSWRLFLGVSLFAWQNATGINAINYYSPRIFTSIGVTGQNATLLTTGVYGIIKMVCTIVWLMYLVDQLGRRKLLMIGSVGGAFAMYYIGAYIAIAKPTENPSPTLTAGGKSAVAFFYIWTIFYSPTWNGTVWVISAEFFPQHVRSFTQACVAASNWLFTFLIARFTPQMFDAMSWGVYIFFSTLMVLSIVYVFFLIPETRQVPLERMHELFASDVRPWNAHRIVMSRTVDLPTTTTMGDHDNEKSFEERREDSV